MAMRTFPGIAVRVLLWILVFLLLVFGAARLQGVSSLLGFSAAVLILPIRKWQDFTGKMLNPSAKTVIAFGLVVMMVLFSPGDAELVNVLETRTTAEPVVITAVPSMSSENTPEATDQAPSAETPAPEATPLPGAIGESEQTYILNTSKMKFHDPECSSVGQMSEKNREEYHGTREDILNRGYSPCGRCKP